MQYNQINSCAAFSITSNMQNLKVSDELYQKLVAFKSKFTPDLPDESELLLFLMATYEKGKPNPICSEMYINEISEISDANSHVTNNSSTPSKIQSTSNVTSTTNTNVHNDSVKKTQSDNVSSDINMDSMSGDSTLYTCSECKYSSIYLTEMEKHFDEYHDMIGTFNFNGMSRFLAHCTTCPIAATDLQQNSLCNEQIPYDSSNNQEMDKSLSEAAGEDQSPDIQSPNDLAFNIEDLDDQPIDFQMNSSSYSNNPLNLVEHENHLASEDSINAVNFDFHKNSFNNDKECLPNSVDDSSSSVNTSLPGNQDQPKKYGKVYKCEDCEKSFKSKGLLDQHKTLHYRPRHECEYCGRRFRRPLQFYTHKRQCSKQKLSLNESKKSNFGHSSMSSSFSNSSEPRISSTEQSVCEFKTNLLPEVYEHKRT